MVTAVAGLLRMAGIVASGIVLIGFLAFANDEASAGSKKQVDRISQAMDAPAPGAAGERAREKQHGKPRELIDDANDVLLRPFAPISENADSRWARRGIPVLLGLLVYGFLLAYFARFARGHG